MQCNLLCLYERSITTFMNHDSSHTGSCIYLLTVHYWTCNTKYYSLLCRCLRTFVFTVYIFRRNCHVNISIIMSVRIYFAFIEYRWNLMCFCARDDLLNSFSYNFALWAIKAVSPVWTHAWYMGTRLTCAILEVSTITPLAYAPFVYTVDDLFI